MAKDILGGITLSGNVCGGWQLVGQPIGSGMPQKLATGWQVAMEGLVGAEYSPIFLVAQQLVNGINYLVIAEQTLITKDPVKHIVGIIINVPFNMTGEGSKIVRIITKDEPEVPEDILALFNSATSKLLGSEHSPILFLGSQIVSGTIFYIVCESKTVRPGAAPVANLCKLWLKPDGTTEVKFERITRR